MTTPVSGEPVVKFVIHRRTSDRVQLFFNGLSWELWEARFALLRLLLSRREEP